MLKFLLITGKVICVIVASVLILWSYYQLFVLEIEKSYLDKQVTAIVPGGPVSGKAVDIKSGNIVIAHDNTTSEVPKQSISRVDNLSTGDYETKRILWAINIAILGGVLIWIVIFF
ncbi:MAG TPA: hypothetical protein VF790_08825 [Dissulfurispiraceae bacterium]